LNKKVGNYVHSVVPHTVCSSDAHQKQVIRNICRRCLPQTTKTCLINKLSTSRYFCSYCTV